MLGERSQKQKPFIKCFHYYEISRTVKSMERERLVAARKWVEGTKRTDHHSGFPWGDENASELGRGDVYITL